MNYILIEPNIHLEFILSETKGFYKNNPTSRSGMKFTAKEVGIIGLHNLTPVSTVFDLLIATRTKACFALPLVTQQLFERIYQEPLPIMDGTQIKLEDYSELIWFNSIAANYQPLTGEFLSHISLDTECPLFDVNMLINDLSLRQEEIHRLNAELDKAGLLIREE